MGELVPAPENGWISTSCGRILSGYYEYVGFIMVGTNNAMLIIDGKYW
jgi:hypothetical protein